MAESKLEIEIKWENNLEFSVQEKHNDGDTSTVIALEENGELVVLWPHVQKALEAYWKAILTNIGEDMKTE